MMTGAVTAVVAALPEEIRPLQQRLHGRSRLRPGRGLKGILGERQVVTMATGDGSERARGGLIRLLAAAEVEAVIAIGIAGGLSKDLRVGDVVVAKRVTNSAGDVPEPADHLLVQALELAGITPGAIHSHSQIAIDPVAKRRLWQETGSHAAQVIDLETASYARSAAAQGVPYVAIRAVSDSSDEALPLDFNLYRRPDGSSDRLAILRHALLHPSIVPELMQLRERLQHCASRLAGLVEEYLCR